MSIGKKQHRSEHLEEVSIGKKQHRSEHLEEVPNGKQHRSELPQHACFSVNSFVPSTPVKKGSQG